MTPLELLLFGAACYFLGLITGARLIPWLVDHGVFPVHTGALWRARAGRRDARP